MTSRTPSTARLLLALLGVSAGPAMGASIDSSPTKLTGHYRLSYESESGVDFSPLSASDTDGGSALAHRLEMALTADLSLADAGPTDAAKRLVLSAKNVRARMILDGSDQPQRAAEIIALLDRGFIVELGSDGRVAALRFPAETGSSAQGFARSLAAALQLVPPPKAGEDAWTSEEEDRAGRYEATYRRVDGNAANEFAILKSKTRYLDTNTPDFDFVPRRTTIATTITPNLEAWFQWDRATGQLLGLDSTERQDVFLAGKPVGHGKVRLQLVSSPGDTTTPPPPAMHGLAAAAPVPLLVRPDARAMELARQQAILGGASVADVLGGIAVDPDHFYPKAKALAWVRPQDCEALGNAIAAAPPTSPAFDVLVRALAAVGHGDAQRALVHALAAHRDDPAPTMRLVAALASAPSPTSSTERAVEAVAVRHDHTLVRQSAVLAMGSMARQLAATDRSRSDAIVRLLSTWLSSPQPAAPRTVVLEALGNAGTQSASVAALKFVDDPDASVRVAALHALRFAGDRDSEAALAEALSLDHDAGVRSAAAFALGYRALTDGVIKAQLDALTADPDENVRHDVLAALARNKPVPDAVRAAIKRSAASDPSDKVRERANAVMLDLPR